MEQQRQYVGIDLHRRGRVRFSKTGQTIYYRGKSLTRIPGGGVSANHLDVETGEEYWVSGVKKNREDRALGWQWSRRGRRGRAQGVRADGRLSGF